MRSKKKEITFYILKFTFYFLISFKFICIERQLRCVFKPSKWCCRWPFQLENELRCLHPRYSRRCVMWTGWRQWSRRSWWTWSPRRPRWSSWRTTVSAERDWRSSPGILLDSAQQERDNRTAQGRTADLGREVRNSGGYLLHLIRGEVSTNAEYPFRTKSSRSPPIWRTLVDIVASTTKPLRLGKISKLSW